MYYFVSLEKIVEFFLKYSIDITSFTTFQTSIVILLSNILVLLFYLFIFYVIYKLIHKVIDWWF